MIDLQDTKVRLLKYFNHSRNKEFELHVEDHDSSQLTITCDSFESKYGRNIHVNITVFDTHELTISFVFDGICQPNLQTYSLINDFHKITPFVTLLIQEKGYITLRYMAMFVLDSEEVLHQLKSIYTFLEEDKTHTLLIAILNKSKRFHLS